MNCIGCGDLVDREGWSDKVCSSCRSALKKCKTEGQRPAYIVSEYFRYVQRELDQDFNVMGR